MCINRHRVYKKRIYILNMQNIFIKGIYATLFIVIIFIEDQINK